MELFSKDSFNVQTVTDFCKEQKMIFQKQIQIQNEVAKILSDASGQIFKDALKGRYLNEGHSEEWIDSVLAPIALTVSSSAKERQQIETFTPILHTYESVLHITNRDKTKYGFLGSGPLPKRKFVWNVIKHFVSENPKTYNEYAKILNVLKPDSQGVIKTYDSLSKAQMIRHFTKESECLQSIDGIKFVVCNQWGDFNIAPIIQFANLQGYNVIEYKS